MYFSFGLVGSVPSKVLCNQYAQYFPYQTGPQRWHIWDWLQDLQSLQDCLQHGWQHFETSLHCYLLYRERFKETVITVF
jgi:hypothetical protein